MKFEAKFAAQPGWLLAVEALVMTSLIGFLDYATSWEVSLYVFYGIPIFAATWYVGRTCGLAIGIFAGVVWYVANLGTHPYLTREGYVWAALNRLFYFAFVAVGGAAMRKLKEEGLARVAALTLARDLEKEVIRAGEREQIRIGQDLHDGVCQNLAAIDCATACLRAELEAGGMSQAAMARQIQDFLRETIVEARNLARGVFPVQVESEGLAVALDELVVKLGFSREGVMSFESSGDVDVPDPAVAMHLYRIAQEAVSNAQRHSGATRIFVRLDREGGTVRLSVRDDGCGLPPQGDRPEGIGLRTMRYRSQLIGAEIAIRGEPGGGTAVECICPVKNAKPRAMEAVAP